MSSAQPTNESQWVDRPSRLSCVSQAEGAGFARLTLTGELSRATAAQLADALAEARVGRAVVILDLRGLTFMNSDGVHVISSARARLAEAGCRLVLLPGGQQVRRIFEVTSRRHFEFISRPSAREPGIVRSRTDAFLHARTGRRRAADTITRDPSTVVRATDVPLPGGSDR